MRVFYIIAACIVIYSLTSCLFNHNVHERRSYGPDGVNIWRSRYFAKWNREPSQQEARAKNAEFKSNVERYISAHPSLTEGKKSNLRTLEVFREMTKAEVVLLLDEPSQIIRDPEGIAKKAQQFWPELKSRVDEAWDYSPYTLFFQGDIVIDIHRDILALQPL
jgi:hypothetical protein